MRFGEVFLNLDKWRIELLLLPLQLKNNVLNMKVKVK